MAEALSGIYLVACAISTFVTPVLATLNSRFGGGVIEQVSNGLAFVNGMMVTAFQKQNTEYAQQLTGYRQAGRTLIRR